jgi:cysteinyl-tRNA synthetase
MLKFFNTLSGKVETFHPLEKGRVKLYTCGPTVYDYAHIGNFRAYMFEDLLKRVLFFKGYDVRHVMNITDVDDKTIKGANEKGISLQEYTRKYIDSFFEDLERLNIIKADFYPRATEHIPEMVGLIKRLLANGVAYRKNGSIYFSIEKFPSYGRLSKIELDALRPGERVDSDEYEKENVHDFALWKGKKEGEPFWETEIGEGRPGWHIECSAMSSKYLGDSFDIHCGGVDNIFPHHENEIAQSEASSGKKFVNYWLHCHHLIVDGEKMAKSKGNQYTLSAVLEQGFSPKAVRLLLLSTHYRKMLNFTFAGLRQIEHSIQRVKDFIHELNSRRFPDGINQNVTSLIDRSLKRFTGGLSDDLNISIAISSFFEMIKKINILISENRFRTKDKETVFEAVNKMDSVLGILDDMTEEALSQDIESKITERQKARQEKNFQRADQIRNELLEKGIVLEDMKDGTVRWKRKPR